MNFEARLKRLEEINQLLSKGDLSLNESIALYEEGLKLVSEMEIELKEAQAKVEKVIDID